MLLCQAPAALVAAVSLYRSSNVTELHVPLMFQSCMFVDVPATFLEL